MVRCCSGYVHAAVMSFFLNIDVLLTVWGRRGDGVLGGERVDGRSTPYLIGHGCQQNRELLFRCWTLIFAVSVIHDRSN